jgi:hypothetical protein
MILAACLDAAQALQCFNPLAPKHAQVVYTATEDSNISKHAV